MEEDRGINYISLEGTEQSKLVNFKKIIEEKDIWIAEQNEKIQLMRNNLTETNKDILEMIDEIANLKQELGKKFVHIKHLQKEKKELMGELEAKQMTNDDIGRESFKLESIFAVEKEKLKLADYENSYKDKKIMRLEKELKQISDDSAASVFQRVSQRRKLSWKKGGYMGKEVGPEENERIRQRSKGGHNKNYHS
eukprot:gene16981-18692_t